MKVSVGLVIKKQFFIWVSAVVLIACLSAAAYGTGAYAVYYNSTMRKLPIYSVGRDDKKISISFDCAWGAEKTEKLLEHMRFYGVKCTFFATEFWVEKYPDTVKKIVDEGHEMATHSATHSYMSKQSEEEITAELKSSREAIEKITGIKVELFRPPYGDYNDKLIKTCEKEGLFAIQWDVDSLDWKDLSANEIAQRVIKRTESGSIILCHNDGKHTADALPLIFADLQGRGYEFVKISELIYREGYTVDHTGKQIRAENN